MTPSDWMKKRTENPIPGDVFEIKHQARFAYIQFVGENTRYGEIIRVAPGLLDSRTNDFESLFSTAYFTLYPINRACKLKMVEKAGALPPPPVPSSWRRRGAIIGMEIKTWFIDESGKDRIVRELSAEEASLPIASIWNHEYLLETIAEGWTPSKGLEGTQTGP